MADQEAIATFISITGASQFVALQTLQVHGGDLNRAVNAYFSTGDRNSARESSIVVPEDDAMDIDETNPLGHLPSTGILNPSSLLDPGLNRSSFDSGPSIAENRPETHGPVIIVDDDDEVIPNSQTGLNVVLNEQRRNVVTDIADSTYPRPSAPVIDDLPDYHNDIEEEMILAAIEASKREAGEVHPDQLSSRPEDLRVSGTQPQSRVADSDLAHAVSLSVKTAEKEKALREAGGSSELEALKSAETGDTGKRALLNGRLDIGSSSVQAEDDDVDEQPLVRRRRSRRVASIDSAEEDPGYEETPPSSPEPDTINRPSQRGTEFPEWGGITSEEHDEAVMLEAAMFGGIPETSGYRLPSAPHHFTQNGFDRNSALYSDHFPRPPSPNLVAQRMIREQQDDEYLASLQADKEKAEARLLEEEAARVAFLEAERLMEEESRKKLEAEQEIERLLTAKEASLPAEPTSDDENSVTLLVKMPDGSRHGRRFLKSDKLQYLFDFIDIGRGAKPGTYKLVRPYPRRAFSDGESGLSLNELGLTSKQEALFLELIKP